MEAWLAEIPVSVWIGGGLALYMAWAIGANDVANAMGTSVGSGALTIRRAIIVAGILEFSGAFFVGGHVTQTVRKGILDMELVAAHYSGGKPKDTHEVTTPSLSNVLKLALSKPDAAD